MGQYCGNHYRLAVLFMAWQEIRRSFLENGNYFGSGIPRLGTVGQRHLVCCGVFKGNPVPWDHANCEQHCPSVCLLPLACSDSGVDSACEMEPCLRCDRNVSVAQKLSGAARLHIPWLLCRLSVGVWYLQYLYPWLSFPHADRRNCFDIADFCLSLVDSQG